MTASPWLYFAAASRQTPLKVGDPENPPPQQVTPAKWFKNTVSAEQHFATCAHSWAALLVPTASTMSISFVFLDLIRPGFFSFLATFAMHLLVICICLHDTNTAWHAQLGGPCMLEPFPTAANIQASNCSSDVKQQVDVPSSGLWTLRSVPSRQLSSALQYFTCTAFGFCCLIANGRFANYRKYHGLARVTERTWSVAVLSTSSLPRH